LKILVPLKRVADPDNANKIKVAPSGPAPEAASGTATIVREDAPLRESAGELCLRCHEPKRAWLSAAVVHAPLQSRQSCLACHRPHTAGSASLLDRPDESLCFGCHDRKPFQRKTVHAALEQGCQTCHTPHAGEKKKLLLDDVNAVCGQCHSDMSKHFHKVQGVTDPRTNEPLTCLGCHNPHSSDLPSLLVYEPTRELCIQCHDPSMGPLRRK